MGRGFVVVFINRVLCSTETFVPGLSFLSVGCSKITGRLTDWRGNPRTIERGAVPPQSLTWYTVDFLTLYGFSSTRSPPPATCASPRCACMSLTLLCCFWLNESVLLIASAVLRVCSRSARPGTPSIPRSTKVPEQHVVLACGDERMMQGLAIFLSVRRCSYRVIISREN